MLLLYVIIQFFSRSKIAPSCTVTSSIQSVPVSLPSTIEEESPSTFTLNWSAGSQIKFDPGSNQVFNEKLSSKTVSDVAEVKHQKAFKWSKSSFAGKSSSVKMSNAKKKIAIRNVAAQKTARRLKEGNIFFVFLSFFKCLED